MLESLSKWEKGLFAEERAFQIYGGIKHPDYGGTKPDLERVHEGKTEFIEVKYVDLSAYSNFSDRLYRTKVQLKKRRKYIPSDALQRLYILCDNPEEFGWSNKAIMDITKYVFRDFDVLIDVEVIRERANEPPEG